MVEGLNDQFVRGEAVDAHQLSINAERLSLGLELTVQVRNKVIEAYQDIMRTQI
ncbi:flagellar hook-basal body protein FliE [compost metagenome]